MAKASKKGSTSAAQAEAPDPAVSEVATAPQTSTSAPVSPGPAAGAPAETAASAPAAPQPELEDAPPPQKGAPPPPKRHVFVALGTFNFPWNGTLISFRENVTYRDVESDLLDAIKAAGCPIEER